jgi:7,8-dihydro-6-hydroxymethylpterin dimethyltransferase
MHVLSVTHTICGVCRELIPAKVVSDGTKVWFHAFCPSHGASSRLVHAHAADYLAGQRSVRPAWTPREFAGNSNAGCPQGCGFCDNHEQHLCLPIIEITSRCDLECPICIANASQTDGWNMGIPELRRVLDGLIRTEGQINVLNFSGGEPLLHPELLQILDEAQSRREIVRVTLSTNGLRLLREPQLVRELGQRNVCVSLQFDGFTEGPYECLRGHPLLQKKLAILELLKAESVTTTLTMTAARGVNDDQFLPMLDYLFANDHVAGMMIQPLAFTGRAAAVKSMAKRLTIPEVLRKLDAAGHPSVSALDFLALPCSHTHCFSASFFVMTDSGRAISVNRVVKPTEILDRLANQVFFGLSSDERDSLKNAVYELWSGAAGNAPDTLAVLATIRGLLRDSSCCEFDARAAFLAAERRVKSIFIHAFQDAETFDLARLRRCCNAYPQPDGTLIPCCAYNLFHRHRDSRIGARAVAE